VAVGRRVPQSIKRALTTLQIAQFVVGATYAAAHLFVSYTVPVSTPYTFTSTLRHPVAVASAVVSSATEAAASGLIGDNWAGLLKKLALRAAGDEGVAENVRNERGEILPPQAPLFRESVKSEIRYRDEWQQVHCLDTSGQAFAIGLNILYLLPLT
jgi:hypothetical protein